MRSKKSKEPKKYVAGGLVLAGVLGAGQSILGAGQMFSGMGAASRIKEASTARPSEYAEMLKQARGAELEQKRLEELNRSIATGIAAAQGAGGRAVIGALPGMIRASDTGALQIFQDRQDRTMQALGIAAQGAEREIGREINREMMERNAAQAAIEGGLQNIAGGVGQIGTAGIYGAQLASKKPAKAGAEAANVSAKGFADIGAPTAPPAGRIDRALMMDAPESKLPMYESLKDSLIDPSSKIQRAFQLPLFEQISDKVEFLKDGGMITDGKFSHKTNPIDIVKKGQKIGEMTGGEVILNPAQQKKLSKESAYFRQLLKKFNKQK